jgi:hypothetical protein
MVEVIDRLTQVLLRTVWFKKRLALASPLSVRAPLARANPSEPVPRSLPNRRSYGRQEDTKGSALTWFGDYFGGSLVRPDDGGDDGQAQAGSGGLSVGVARPCSIHPVEAFEHPFRLFRAKTVCRLELLKFKVIR